MTKKITLSRFLAAFAITALIFFAGITTSNYINNQRTNTIELLQQDYTMNLQGVQIEYDLLKENPCERFNSTEMTLELWKIGTKLTYLESKLGPKDPYVKSLKENYHLLSIRHWMFMKEASAKCNTSIDNIIYFYSDNELCPDCEEQGNILTYIHKNYPVFNIYSFDSEIDNPAIRTMKTIFNIKYTPSIVIDGVTYEGFQSKKDLLTILYPIINRSGYLEENVQSN
ncbi:thioredoxin family protein [Candidatus Woesearchaeota archaeon]|nr:thioredoxin family protein [Candidatus Woesearchaeota archaeon]